MAYIRLPSYGCKKTTESHLLLATKLVLGFRFESGVKTVFLCLSLRDSSSVALGHTSKNGFPSHRNTWGEGFLKGFCPTSMDPPNDQFTKSYYLRRNSFFYRLRVQTALITSHLFRPLLGDFVKAQDNIKTQKLKTIMLVSSRLTACLILQYT